MRKGSTTRLIVAAGAVIVLALPAATGAAPTWLSPKDLSAPGEIAGRADVAMDPAGDVVAVWGAAGVVRASVRPAGADWSAPQDLSAPGANAGVPQVAVDAAGNAVAIWLAGGGILQTASRSAASGMWSPPQDLSTAGAQDAQLAVNAAGDAIAVWRLVNGSTNIVQSAFRPVGGAWGPPQNLQTTGSPESLFTPQVGLDGDGNAVAVWDHARLTNTPQGFRLFIKAQASRRPAASGLWETPPTDLSGAAAEGASSARVAVDRSGTAIAVWAKDGSLHSAVAPPGGAWGSSAPIPGNPGGETLAIDPNGNALLVGSVSPSGGGAIRASWRPAGGTWGATEDVYTTGLQHTLPQVALDADGNAVAVWELYDGSLIRVQAARRARATGTWSFFGATPDISPGVMFSAPGTFAPQIAVDAAGNGIAGWRFWNGSHMVAQAIGLDFAGPALRNLTIPATGVAGVPLSFSVSPLDVWSALLGQPQWAFGDGTTGVGSSIAHTYASPGTYAVAVNQADTVANQTLATGTVTIAAAPPPPPPSPPPARPPVRRCVVPRVVGRKLAKAKAAIKKARCRTGKVRRAYSRKRKKGFVLAQKPKAGRRLAVGARVNLVVSRGRRPVKR